MCKALGNLQEGKKTQLREKSTLKELVKAKNSEFHNIHYFGCMNLFGNLDV
jgi:hypothetical protein